MANCDDNDKSRKAFFVIVSENCKRGNPNHCHSECRKESTADKKCLNLSSKSPYFESVNSKSSPYLADGQHINPPPPPLTCKRGFQPKAPSLAKGGLGGG
ncbi:hypothetical protein [Campylobacter troglodytis]|uniref:hypothetical protein n=1 Tax=Campylobacter troglodytis TaxID=654363 RepID=UPI00115A0582|nr:hypothetical protein [Campylobacter troglodytis]TQR58595.1 hypothetical protein DMC01_07700 [Campylobacter troglodytis]